jgi:hypothetical protein
VLWCIVADTCLGHHAGFLHSVAPVRACRRFLGLAYSRRPRDAASETFSAFGRRRIIMAHGSTHIIGTVSGLTRIFLSIGQAKP